MKQVYPLFASRYGTWSQESAMRQPYIVGRPATSIFARMSVHAVSRAQHSLVFFRFIQQQRLGKVFEQVRRANDLLWGLYPTRVFLGRDSSVYILFNPHINDYYPNLLKNDVPSAGLALSLFVGELDAAEESQVLLSPGTHTVLALTRQTFRTSERRSRTINFDKPRQRPCTETITYQHFDYGRSSGVCHMSYRGMIYDIRYVYILSYLHIICYDISGIQYHML